MPATFIRASANDLARNGLQRLDPGRLALFSTQQYESPGFPFLRFDNDLSVPWVWGTDTVTDEPILVPASIVFTGYALGGNPGVYEPLTNPPINAGIAAGQDANSALGNALLEVVERDCVWRVWADGGQAIECRPSPEWLEDLTRGPDGRFELELFSFPNDLGLAVVGALVTDRMTSVQLMGTACRESWETAAKKAIAEAFQLHVIANSLLDQDAPIHLAAAQGGALKPWRRARDYRVLYRSDWRDLRDQLCHVQLYLDPEMAPLLDEQLASARTGPTPRSIVAGTSETLSGRLSRRGFRVIAVDVTTDDVRAAGFTVIRAVVPGMYSNAPAAFPFLGGQRLRVGDRVPPPLPYA